MKKNIIYLILVGFVCFFIGFCIAYIYQKEQYKKLEWKIDSLEKMEYIRENEQLPYYGMKKEEVLSLLPKPQNHSIGTLFDDGTTSQWHWIVNSYKSKLEGTQDTIIIDAYDWYIPYHDRPNLSIVFEKTDEGWIATTCVQWDGERVHIDW